MQFRIADTFTDSLARLSGEEQKAAKMTAFDLQLNPTAPGMGFHRLERAKDKDFWSVRASSDLRIIVHRSADNLLLCYVDHHDKAYAWAARRRLEVHPATGAAQLVEVRERVEEVIIRVPVPEAATAPRSRPLFADRPAAELLGYGVPEEWLEDVHQVNEDGLLRLAEHLPMEAAEALLELATGGRPRPAAAPPHLQSPFDHPEAQRRFRVLTSVEELQRALDYPWDKWTVFLHPEQRDWVERDYRGPARVSGSAGTGKTIVALHRAVHLARTHPEARVLLATFSAPLANALQGKLRCLVYNEPRLAERIDVHALDAIGRRLLEGRIGPVRIVAREDLLGLLRAASRSVPGHKLSLGFLAAEWDQVVDAWQLSSWETYRDVARPGRRSRLAEAQRAVLWAIFEQVATGLKRHGWITRAGMFTTLAAKLAMAPSPPFDFAVVDEAQDLDVAQLRFLAALGGGRPNGLFFAGDIGQRIFQPPFSWKSLGVDVRGRSRTLRVNYRTSHQIRRQADRLLAPAMADLDGIQEGRDDTVSVFNGPVPVIQAFESASAEARAVGAWVAAQIAGGVDAAEIAVFVRSAAELPRCQSALTGAGVPFIVLDEQVRTARGHVALCTMHLAKGLEFRAVAVMACDDEIIPSQARIEAVGDDADLQEVYDTERHLLYVACTRARDLLLVSSGGPPSEFLSDLVS